MNDDLQQRSQHADLIAPGPLRTLERSYQILRYYKKRQLLSRLWQNTVGKHLGRTTVPHVAQMVFPAERQQRFATLASCRVARGVFAPVAPLENTTENPIEDTVENTVKNTFENTNKSTGDTSTADLVHNLRQGTFTLLGETRALGTPIDWSGGEAAGDERLWQFQLHYHETLLDALTSAAPQPDEIANVIVSQIIMDWLAAHPAQQADSRGNAWHPYCISRRLPIWLQLLSIGNFSDQLQQRMVGSMAVQAEILYHHLETDLGGNHLLENARALALAGCALQTQQSGQQNQPKRWLDTAERILRREMPEQLLPHAEHYERSPMYHAQVLGNLLQIAIVAQDVRPALATACLDWARPMWEFLQSILHPDGEIPLFADSCFGETYAIEELRRLVEATTTIDTSAKGSRNLASIAHHEAARSPYWISRDDADAWIVDGGAAAADTLPAHGHCDLGGFEASIGGARWFVDSGLYGYGDDSMRRYCRSSLAHNVVTVEDRNQFDIWSRFRMGYRVRPKSFQTGATGGYRWAHSVHGAYRRLGVGLVHRITGAGPGKSWVCIEHVESAGEQRVVGRLHLSHEVTTEQVGPCTWRLTSAKHHRLLQFSGVAQVAVTRGWYAPRFGHRVAVDTLEYEAAPGEPALMGWTLLPADQAQVPTLEFDRTDGGTPVASLVDAGGERLCQWQLVLPPDGSK